MDTVGHIDSEWIGNIALLSVCTNHRLSENRERVSEFVIVFTVAMILAVYPNVNTQILNIFLQDPDGQG